MELWIVGKINPENCKEWEFQGIFSKEQKAVDACDDGNCFVAPVVLDAEVPTESVLWPNAYYPGGEQSRDPAAEVVKE